MPPNLALVYIAGFLRALGIGLTGVILGIYLSRAGLSATAIGLVIGAGLAGAAAGTLLVSLRADQLGRRNTLVALSLLGCVGGGGVALAGALPGFALLAFLGMLNGMGRDRGPAFSLDQAILADIARPERRTWVMAWYNVLLDAGHALGALAGALPFVFRERLAVDLLASYKLTFGLCAALSLLSGTVYLFLTTRIEAAPAPNGVPGGASKISPHSKKIVARLASLIAVDALGGGFLTSALLAYWFFRRFGVSEAGLGPLFFAARLLNACSHPLAAWLAHRAGLLNTMVFTHAVSSLFLACVPFAPSFVWAAALFLARESMVQMDVPTRQSYIVGVVQPGERTFATGVTTLTRNIGWAVVPSLAGYLMQALAPAAPIFLGSGLKITYDLLLYFAFRRLKPPEETGVV